MKILLLIDSLDSGGAQRQMITLAEMLTKKQYDISFLVYWKEDFFIYKLDQLGIPVHYIIESRPLYRIWKIRKFIRAGKYDVVVSFLETPNFLNCISAIGGKTWKVVTSERSAKESTFLSMKGKIFGWFQRYSDALVCNSYNAEAMWEKYYPQYKDKLSVIYNPVILQDITSEYTPKRNGKLHIVVAASYQYLKNPIRLIKALAMLNKNERAKIEVNWYGRVEVSRGNTKAFDDSVSLIEEYNLEGIIYLNEATKDVVNKMNEADIVALFSEVEGLPNAICEGMMIGKPIIMTQVSDYSALVDSSNGFLCDWNSPQSIKSTLINALNLTEKELVKMGLNSKKKAENLFLENNILNSWIRIVRQMSM